jgi:HK97 family phage prohead protease
MKTKRAFPLASFKAKDKAGGTFEALVSVFGNIDVVGDRVLPGAFTKSLDRWESTGDPIPVIWSHMWDDPFAHIGKITTAVETKDGLRVEGQIDMDKPFAAQVYDLMAERRVKEWSFAYDVIEEDRAKDGANELKELELFEVGPTLKGANPDTQLYGVKAVAAEMEAQRKAAIRSHSTTTSDATWDGPAQEAKLPNEAAPLKMAHAWQDPDGDDTVKDSYKFIHHFVTDSGVGAASTVACSTGIGVLNGGRGGTTIPDADRQGVYAHLKRHLTDDGRDAPPLKSLAGREREELALIVKELGVRGVSLPMATNAQGDAVVDLEALSRVLSPTT